MGNSSSKSTVKPQYKPDVPPAFRFSRERHMVLSANGNELQCFPTERSLEVCKSALLSGSRLTLSPGALGVPLLGLERRGSLPQGDGYDMPYCSIYKCVLQSSTEPPSHKNSEILLRDDAQIVYKVPFCEVTKRTWSEGRRATYKMKVSTIDGIQIIEMAQHRWGYDLDTKLGSWNVQWHDKGFETVNLITIPEGMPSFLDDDETRIRKCKKKTKAPASEKYMCAKLVSTGKTYSPTVFATLAHLCVGEIDMEVDPHSYGLVNVPWYSQIIACMGLIVCNIQLERRNELNDGRAVTRREALLRDITRGYRDQATSPWLYAYNMGN
ncbi:LAFE_0C07140g1_1 [Lachancea fermentati]|uniref:LAFE_0C07140g1_1 n=1 Tax=Lachancea fermentati TaxID=4955 RepID=A0A1G4M9S3_LACFM|nr:LAFE_0C07140g1_1 [Lachancea fermentati]